MVALPVMAQTCSWSRGTRSTLEAIGAVAKVLFVCKRGRSLVALRPITGAPTNWFSLDNTDTDLGGCGAVLIDVSGATPSQQALALGKDGKAYLLRRNNLGGITAPVAPAHVANSVRGKSCATYRTNQGTYFFFRNGSSAVSAYKITATNPPTIIPAWTK